MSVKMDWWGAILSSAGLILVVFALTDSAHAPRGWSTPYIYSLLIVGVILLAGAFYVEGWVAEEPLLPLDIFSMKYMKPLVLALFFTWGNLGMGLKFLPPACARLTLERCVHALCDVLYGPDHGRHTTAVGRLVDSYSRWWGPHCHRRRIHSSLGSGDDPRYCGWRSLAYCTPSLRSRSTRRKLLGIYLPGNGMHYRRHRHDFQHHEHIHHHEHAAKATRRCGGVNQQLDSSWHRLLAGDR